MHKILILDDEVEILNSLKRVFRKTYDVFTFDNGEAALAAMEEHLFAVIISDMRMPHMDGATFLTKAKALSPNSVRILLTGYADMESTVKAINDGGIFSYANKPWNNDDIKQLVANALNHFNLKIENQRLTLELTEANDKLTNINAQLEIKVQERTKSLNLTNIRLKGSVQKQRTMFKNLLEMVSLVIEDREGENNGHNKRVALHCKLLAEALDLDKTEVNQIYLAALMHNVGKVGIPDELLALAEYEQNAKQQELYQSHALKGQKILAQLPNLVFIANIVKHQYENYDGSGFPEHLVGEDIPSGSRIIKIVSDYDKLLLGKKIGHKMSPDEAVKFLIKHKEELYDATIVNTYRSLLTKLPGIDDLNVEYCVSADKLEPGMCLAKDLYNKSGGVMLTKETELTQLAISKLKEYESSNGFTFSIFVY